MKYLYNTCKELGVFQIRIELIVYTVTTIKEQDFCFSHMRFEKIDTEATLANRRLQAVYFDNLSGTLTEFTVLSFVFYKQSKTQENGIFRSHDFQRHVQIRSKDRSNKTAVQQLRWAELEAELESSL